MSDDQPSEREEALVFEIVVLRHRLETMHRNNMLLREQVDLLKTKVMIDEPPAASSPAPPPKVKDNCMRIGDGLFAPGLAFAILLWANTVFAFSIGDRVQVTQPVWVHPVCPGFAPACAIGPGSPTEPVYQAGIMGTVTAGDSVVDGFTWNKVQFDAPLIEGYVTVANLALVAQTPPGKVQGVSLVVETVVTLSWNANIEADLAGYRVYMREVGGQYGTQLADVTGSTLYQVTLPPGKEFQFTITAYDFALNESLRSNEVTFSTR